MSIVQVTSLKLIAFEIHEKPLCDHSYEQFPSDASKVLESLCQIHPFPENILPFKMLVISDFTNTIISINRTSNEMI